MAIPPVRPEKIQEAMSRFDRELRNHPDWANWEDKQNFIYAIVDDHGQRYPVKQIVRMAVGDPNLEFSGGEDASQANQYVRACGFTVIRLREGSAGALGNVLKHIGANYLVAVTNSMESHPLAVYIR